MQLSDELDLMMAHAPKNMNVNNKYTLEESTGWKFHSLNDVNIVAGSSIADNATSCTLVHDLNSDGFITLSALLTSQFISELRIECMDIFHSVLELLYVRGNVDFKDSYRRRKQRESRLIEKVQSTEQETILNDTQSKSNHNSNTSSKEGRYEYPLGLGLKNGYRELVMRSPGRYELALLLDEIPLIQQAKNGHVPDTASAADYEGKWLLNTTLLRMAKEAEDGNQQEQDFETNTEQQCHCCKEDKEEENTSCLKQLLEWIASGSSDASPNMNARDDKTHNASQEQYPIDKENVKRFMKFVGAIYPPPPPSATSSSSREADGINGCNDSSTEIESKEIDRAQHQQQQHRNIDDYYLCNLSLLVATPGCPTQSWHADGGHVSLAKHKKCHVFNVFIPLVDVPTVMGPTEIRPGTHYHTRNLAPMLLAAKARKTLRQPVIPQIKMGDALIFDYRVLHRGRANTSDEDEDEEEDGTTTEECVVGKDLRGKDRPVLVLTFARRWFVDVCNFPKHSIFVQKIHSKNN